MKTKFFIMLFFITTFILTNPARASSCNSPGGILAGIFTGGISYQICKAKEAVNTMIQLVNETRSRMRNLIDDTINHSKQVIENRGNYFQNQIDGKMNALRRISTQSKHIASSIIADEQRGRRVGASGRASGTDIINAVNGATRSIEALLQQANTQSALPISNIIRDARASAHRQARSAARIGHDLALEPLRLLGDTLLSLLRDPRNLLDPTRTITTQVRAINNSIERTVVRIRNEILNEAETILSNVTPQSTQVLDYNSLGIQQIEAALRLVARDRSQRAVSQLLYTSGQRQAQQQDQQQSQNQRGSTSNSTLIKSNIGNIALSNNTLNPIQFNTDAIQNQHTTNNQASEISKIKGLIKKINDDHKHLGKLRSKSYKMPSNLENQAEQELQKLFAGKSTVEQNRIKNKIKNDSLTKINDFPQQRRKYNQQFDARLAKALRMPLKPGLSKPLNNREINNTKLNHLSR